MISINLEKDFLKLMNNLGEVKVTQLPFAVAKALNELALDARPLVQEEYQKELTIRNKGLLKKGIQINWAKKNDWPFSQSEVGIPDSFSFLADHVTGMDRTSRSSGGKAVPQDLKRSSSGKMPNSLRPSALLKKKKNFIIHTNAGKKIIVQRTGKESGAIKIMYGFTKTAKIQNKVSFEAQVTNMFSSRFDLVLGRQLAKAIANIKT